MNCNNKDDIIGKEFLQNCGDTLFVIEKSNKKSLIRNIYLYKGIFKKYSYEIFAEKRSIITGNVINPLIEQIEFIDKIWPQNCGDSLRIIKKVGGEGKNSKWECEFIKYPYKIIAYKYQVINKWVFNPLVEKYEFIDKIWPQNCGDSLKILGKSEKKNKKGKGNILYECQFLKYPLKENIFKSKQEIKKGICFNPRIEEITFINKIWPQNCGDSLKILGKSEKRNSSREFLWKCKFIKNEYEIIAQKSNIIKGEVDNPIFPWKNKTQLENYICSNFEDKITLFTLTEKLNKDFNNNLSIITIGSKIIEYQLKNYIKYYYTGIEEIIINYIKLLTNYEIEQGNCKLLNNGKEIDIYIPSLKFGIEYNGNLWHSTHPKLGKKDNYLYHQEKSLLAQEKGISLFHIFEYEYLEKEEIIKSLIKSKLGIFDKKIGARQCKIKELDYKTYAKFCNENHLQGEAGAKVKLGLYYQEELVQVMSFSLPRFTSDFDWEIIRECSKLGYQIIGGKEKLWKYFVKTYNPRSCISYCDFSKFDGNSYLKLGFKKERLNKPGFVWYDEKLNITYWRNPYKNQEMKDKGYLKIYDCGQLVFSWTK